ncbi:MAG: hypothetical protein WDM79_08035 [Terricaulis sp.]
MELQVISPVSSSNEPWTMPPVSVPTRRQEVADGFSRVEFDVEDGFVASPGSVVKVMVSPAATTSPPADGS